jgi:cyclopropane fatty-acyl-phospholipid synthase-like methyltransferase
MTRATCGGCGASGLVPVLSLGEMPPVNAFVDPGAARPRAFPLDLHFCERCTLVQLAPPVDPELLFGTYTYLASASQTNAARLEALADRVAEDFNLGRDARVLELGSNDGTLLARLARRTSARILGVDPARNVAELARAAGVPTIPSFFGSRLARELRRERGAFDLVLALNVVAHTPDLVDFFAGVRHVLAADGHFVVEVVHVQETLARGQIDTVYHEHVYCFSLRALAHAAASAGLVVVDVERIEAQGGSLRAIMQRAERARAPSARVGAVLADERAAGLDRASTFQRVGDLARALRERVRGRVGELRRSKGVDVVVGLGASARGVVLLNYCGLGPADLDFVVDDTPLKQGKLVPGCGVPVRPWDAIPAGARVGALMLSWNYRTEILTKLAARSPWARVVAPLPALEEIVVAPSEAA